MMQASVLARLRTWTLAGGCLLFGGCAALERGLDLVLAPAASGNLLVVPYTALRGLITFMVGSVA